MFNYLFKKFKDRRREAMGSYKHTVTRIETIESNATKLTVQISDTSTDVEKSRKKLEDTVKCMVQDIKKTLEFEVTTKQQDCWETTIKSNGYYMNSDVTVMATRVNKNFELFIDTADKDEILNVVDIILGYNCIEYISIEQYILNEDEEKKTLKIFASKKALEEVKEYMEEAFNGEVRDINSIDIEELEFKEAQSSDYDSYGKIELTAEQSKELNKLTNIDSLINKDIATKVINILSKKSEKQIGVKVTVDFEVGL